MNPETVIEWSLIVSMATEEEIHLLPDRLWWRFLELFKVRVDVETVKHQANTHRSSELNMKRWTFYYKFDPRMKIYVLY